MAITFQTWAGTVIGPGTWGRVNGLTGPVPIDDYIDVNIHDNATNTIAPLFTIASCKGSTFPNFQFGQRIFPFPLGGDEVSPLAAGTAIRIDVLQFHAGGTLVATAGPFVGYTWDPIGNLGTLMAWWNTNGGTGLSASILAAVQQTYSHRP